MFAARLLLTDRWLVTGLGAATSVGMIAGAVTGWWLVARSARDRTLIISALLRPLGAGLLAGTVAGALPSWLSQPLTGASLGDAVLAALATGAGCLLIFLAVLAAVDRTQLRRLRALRSLRVRDDLKG